MPKYDMLILSIFFLFLFVPLISCGDDKQVNIDRYDVQYIDSVFFARRDSITKLADSLCEQQYPGILSSAIDSIKAVRLEEIESILGK